jgi:hypothetical protein
MLRHVDEIAPEAIKYMNSRMGTFEFRAKTRYMKAYCALVSIGLKSEHVLLDIGAGSCQFDHFMRTRFRWMGRYLPVDATLDGTNLNNWKPKAKVDFVVCLETLEHLKVPDRMLRHIRSAAKYGAVVTVPNPDVVDVLRCDPTHVSVVDPGMLLRHGFEVTPVNCFGKKDDTLLGVLSR